MENNAITKKEWAPASVLPPEALLHHWQEHRRLTRRVIEAFPEDELFRFAIGGMRPFAELAMEMIRLAGIGIRGVATGQWNGGDHLARYALVLESCSRRELLQLWDEVTTQINEYWPWIPPHRFQEMTMAFDQYEGPVYAIILYWIDNEIHHRGQGYVYLRALGIVPPPFWDRN